MYEDSVKEYPKWKPFTISFNTVEGKDENDNVSIDIGVVFVNERFETRILMNGVLAFDSDKEKYYWNKHYFVTITNTKDVKKHTYIERSLPAYDKRPQFFKKDEE